MDIAQNKNLELPGSHTAVRLLYFNATCFQHFSSKLIILSGQLLSDVIDLVHFGDPSVLISSTCNFVKANEK